MSDLLKELGKAIAVNQGVIDGLQETSRDHHNMLMALAKRHGGQLTFTDDELAHQDEDCLDYSYNRCAGVTTVKLSRQPKPEATA